MGPTARAWRWFVGLRPQRLFDLLWLVVAVIVTLSMTAFLAKAVVLSGGIEPWLLRDEASVSFLGSYALCSVAATWYFLRMRRLQPTWEAAVGATIIWALSPAYAVVVVGLSICLLICELGKRCRLVFDRGFAERYRGIVECRLARREGIIRERAGPVDRSWSEPGLN